MIQFLFRRAGTIVATPESTRKGSWLSTLSFGTGRRLAKSGEWTDKLASSLDTKIRERKIAPLGLQEPELQTSLDLALRLEGPYFSPADPSRYHTAVCLVAGTGISGAMAIAGAFSALQQKRLVADAESSKSPESFSQGPAWRRCIINWSVREQDFVNLPDLEQSLGVDFQVNLTGSGRQRPNMKRIMSEIRETMPPDAAIWSYISGPKGFIENAKMVCKAIPNVDIHAASWEI